MKAFGIIKWVLTYRSRGGESSLGHFGAVSPRTVGDLNSRLVVELRVLLPNRGRPRCTSLSLHATAVIAAMIGSRDLGSRDQVVVNSRPDQMSTIIAKPREVAP